VPGCRQRLHPEPGVLNVTATTLIQNADTVVAWDDSRQSHVYMRNTDVAFRDGRIIHVGPGYAAGPDCEIVDGRGMMVMPGLVDIHSHLVHEPINKGYTDETGSAGLYNSNLYEYMPPMEGDDEAAPHQLTLACAELLMSGVTTVVDMSVAHEHWIDILAKSGLRAHVTDRKSVV